MVKKVQVMIAFLMLILTTIASSILAEELPILHRKYFWTPIASNSVQTIASSFNAIDIDSTYQITVTKALPSPYKSKLCLSQTCVQNSLVLDTIPAHTSGEMQFRVYSKEIVPDQETLFRFLLGPIENSSKAISGTVYVYPVEKKSIQFAIDSTDVLVNGKKEKMDVGPVIVQSRTYVPFRYLSTVFGANVSYTMNPDTKLVDTVTYTLGNFSLILTIGSTDYTVQVQNEKQVKSSDGKPFITKGRTLVPLRLISESLCSLVEWNGTNRTVHIQFPKECNPETFEDIFYTDIKAEEVHQKIENEEPLTIIDLRTQEDYNHAHIPGAINIHISTLKTTMPTKTEIGKESQIVVYCKSGAQSIFGSEILTNLGYKKVHNLALGFASWKYDVEKSE